MADFDAWQDPHSLFQHNSPLQPKPTARPRPRRGSLFCSSFLFRLLLIALFLSLVPLLPSHPPEFVSRTVFASTWELLRLLLIGILVSYGMFGRPRPQIQTPIPISHALNPPNILHASSIFSFDHHHDHPYNNGDRDCRFRPYGFEPTVVVRPGTYEFDGEPLDLPVRSLRSRVEESDSEEPASEFELEADGSSSCRSEDDMVASSPTPWDWPSQSSSVESRPSLSNQSSPLRSSSSESPPMGVKLSPSPTSLTSRSMGVSFRENVGDASLKVDTNFMPPPHSERRDSKRVCSWSDPMIQENVFVSRLTPSKLRQMAVDPVEEVGSAPMEEWPTIEVENSRSNTKLFPSPKSRSMRVDFKEQIGDASLQEDTESVPPVRSFIPPSLQEDIESSRVESEVSQREHKQQRHLPPSLSDFSPLCSPASESATTEMLIPQKESKAVDTSWKDNDLSLRRVSSRRRRSRKRDDLREGVKGTMKSRTESSCDTASSQSLSSSSHDFGSTTEPKSSRHIDGFSVDENVHTPPLNSTPKETRSTEVEDFESESIPVQAGGSSSLSKLESGTKTLSRTSHSRRFSCSSFFDRDVWKGSRDGAKEMNKKGKNADTSRGGKCGWDCLKLDVKPTLTAKGSVRGRSVRTIRPAAITSSDPSCKSDNASVERVRERQDVVIISIGISEKRDRNHEEGRKQEQQQQPSISRDKAGSERTGCTHSLPAQFAQFERVFPKDGNKEVNEDEDGNSEIDRKADEFIAKFKEQIRQQKVVSRRESNKHPSGS